MPAISWRPRGRRRWVRRCSRIRGRTERSMTLTELGQDRRSALLDCQRRILERIASGAPLAESLGTLVRLIEEQAPDMRCAVLLADEEKGTLSLVAAPNIPQDYQEGIQPYLRIADAMGSCRTATELRP